MAQRIRWKFGHHEIEIEGDENFIEKQLARFEERVASAKLDAGEKTPGKSEAETHSPDLAPAEFFRKKNPSSGPKKIAVLGKYLQTFRGHKTFSKSEISKLTEEIRVDDIHPTDYARALHRGWLRELDGGLTLTMTGDEIVDAMGGDASRGGNEP